MCVLVIKQIFSERISVALTSQSLPKHPLLPMKNYELEMWKTFNQKSMWYYIIT